MSQIYTRAVSFNIDKLIKADIDNKLGVVTRSGKLRL